MKYEPQVQKPNCFETATAMFGQSTPILQHLRLGHHHYPCQALADAQFAAVAADSAYERTFKAYGLRLCVRASFEASSHFGAKIRDLHPHTTGSTVHFTEQPTDSLADGCCSLGGVCVVIARTSVYGCLASWPRKLAKVCDFFLILRNSRWFGPHHMLRRPLQMLGPTALVIACGARTIVLAYGGL